MKPIPRNRSLIVWRKNYISGKTRKLAKTICDILQELYADAELRGDMPNMQRIETCNDMAKRMQDRLKFYSVRFKQAKGTMTVDDVGDIYWISKHEFQRADKRRRKGKVR